MNRASWKGALLVALASGGIASAQQPEPLIAVEQPQGLPAAAGCGGCQSHAQFLHHFDLPALHHGTSAGYRWCFPDHAPGFGYTPTQWRRFPQDVAARPALPPRVAPSDQRELLPPPSESSK